MNATLKIKKYHRFYSSVSRISFSTFKIICTEEAYLWEQSADRKILKRTPVLGEGGKREDKRRGQRNEKATERSKMKKDEIYNN